MTDRINPYVLDFLDPASRPSPEDSHITMVDPGYPFLRDHPPDLNLIVYHNCLPSRALSRNVHHGAGNHLPASLLTDDRPAWL